jgi:hypothetical protein
MEKIAILIGTHHTDDAYLMKDVCSSFASSTEFNYLDISTNNGSINNQDEKLDYVAEKSKNHHKFIIFDEHSEFPDLRDIFEEISGFRIIRDPRDILLSSLEPHKWSIDNLLQKTDSDSEQKELNKRSSFYKKIKLAMKSELGLAINKMIMFGLRDNLGNYNNIQELTYEKFRQYPNVYELNRALQHLRHRDVEFTNNKLCPILSSKFSENEFTILIEHITNNPKFSGFDFEDYEQKRINRHTEFSKPLPMDSAYDLYSKELITFAFEYNYK